LYLLTQAVSTWAKQGTTQKTKNRIVRIFLCIGHLPEKQVKGERFSAEGGSLPAKDWQAGASGGKV